MKNFINLKDIPAKDLRKILNDAKKRKKKRIQILSHPHQFNLKQYLLHLREKIFLEPHKLVRAKL